MTRRITTCIEGPQTIIPAGSVINLDWQAPDTGGNPIAEVGLEISAQEPAGGTINLDFLTWDGVPKMNFQRPVSGGIMWRHAWVNAVDSWEAFWPETYRLVQNNGRGLIIQGCREWDAYLFEAELKPHMPEAGGIAVHVHGLKRYYALLLQKDAKIQLIKVLDGEQILAENPWIGPWNRLIHEA